MIDVDVYADLALESAYQYAEDIRSGEIRSNKWIRLAVDRYYKDRKRKDLVQDLDRVRDVFRFFSLVNINIKGDYRQFEILPYQAFIALNLFLFYYRSTGKRRYRYMFLFIAKKNGKTVFAVLLNLYFLVLDGVTDPQSLLLASTREQANVALDYAKSIVLNSPALQRRLRIMQYQIRFEYGASRGFMKTLAAEPKRLDGYNVSSAILDEIHSYVDDHLFNVIKGGILARTNPMILLISTAGFKIDSFCYTYFENCKNLLLGNVEDDSLFVLLYTLDESDDYKDPDNWIKANPALGKIILIEDLKIEYRSAVNIASQLPNFLTKHLNLFVETAERWIPEDVLLRTNTAFDLKEFKGADVYIGLDLSSTRDLTSAVCLFHNPETDRYFVYPLFWFADNKHKKLRKGGIDISVWLRQGLINQCQTETIDYDLVFQGFVNLNKDYSIVAVGYDAFNSDLIVPRLEDIGINCVRFEQTARAFNFPLKYLEKLIYDSRISFGKNPVLLWNFRNVVLYIDGNGNIKIMKNRSKDSVDGAVACGMSVAMWLAVNLDPQRSNIAAYLNYTNQE